MAKTSLAKRTRPVGLQPVLDEYGNILVKKIVAAEGVGAVGAQAHLYRTLVEYSIPKPEVHVNMAGFQGDVVIKVEGVD